MRRARGKLMAVLAGAGLILGGVMAAAPAAAGPPTNMKDRGVRADAWLEVTDPVTGDMTNWSVNSWQTVGGDAQVEVRRVDASTVTCPVTGPAVREIQTELVGPGSIRIVKGELSAVVTITGEVVRFSKPVCPDDTLLYESLGAMTATLTLAPTGQPTVYREHQGNLTPSLFRERYRYRTTDQPAVGELRWLGLVVGGMAGDVSLFASASHTSYDGPLAAALSSHTSNGATSVEGQTVIAEREIITDVEPADGQVIDTYSMVRGWINGDGADVFAERAAARWVSCGDHLAISWVDEFGVGRGTVSVDSRATAGTVSGTVSMEVFTFDGCTEQESSVPGDELSVSASLTGAGPLNHYLGVLQTNVRGTGMQHVRMLDYTRLGEGTLTLGADRLDTTWGYLLTGTTVDHVVKLDLGP